MLLIVLIFCSPFAGFAVLCHGSDGHVAIEAPGHDHCHCAESDSAGGDHAAEHNGSTIASSHDHCNDSLLTADAIAHRLKLSKTFSQTAESAPLRSYLNAYSQACAVTVPKPRSGLFRYHEPLQSVIIIV
ncbi:hypothetical protein [Anaerohalosphaera lusitana]|nr:hypothetical protein [Anaerohalosphaera lusitana]